MSQPQRPDPGLLEAQHEQQKEGQAHGANLQTGHGDVRSPTIDFDSFRDSDLIETVFSPKFDRSDDVRGGAPHLGEKFDSEFAGHTGLANITQDHWDREWHMDRARAMMAKNEYRREGGVGSKCTGKTREIMTDDDANGSRPVLTDDRARDIESTFREVSMLRSLSIDARGFRGITEAIVYSVTEGYETDHSGESGGLVSNTLGRVIP